MTSIAQPSFLTGESLSNIVVQSTVPAIVAIGMTFVIITGGIDLSVGSIVALASIALSLVAKNDFSPWVWLLAALSSGFLVGLANGLMVARLGFAPFLATLGTMGIARGAAFVLSRGQPISGVTGDLRFLYDTSLPFLPVSVIIVVTVAAVFQFLLKETVWGYRLYAVGSNENAARLIGISVNRFKATTYMLSGSFAGLAGLLLTSRLNSGQPLAGALYELDAIAAVIIGGGSLKGGRGDIIGTLLGVILVVSLRNAVTVLGLPTHAQPMVTGMLLLVVVGLDRLRRTLERRKAHETN